MKRIVAIIIGLVLLTSLSACKPDNITYPSVINNSNDSSEPEKETQSGTAQTGEVTGTTTKEKTQENAATTTQGNAEATEAEKITQQSAEALTGASGNPLALATFVPSATEKSVLGFSGLIKGAAQTILKNKAITLYTASELPAFSYKDADNNTVTEWDWFTKAAAANGFVLKYTVKNESVSLKAQRVALFAGKKLSLIQMTADNLAAGMTLSTSASGFLNLDNTSYGISKAILTQSNQTLFAPIGNINALWYNTALMPSGKDPATLYKNGQWTIDQFKEISNKNAESKIVPFIIKETLAFGLISGKSPLTLLNGKLDSNINAKATHPVWSALRNLNSQLPTFVKEEDTKYSLKEGTVAMEYTTQPEKNEKMKLSYAPLPALEAGGPTATSFTGTFFALPKYEVSESTQLAALTFAELWCNRYAEARAGQLLALNILGSGYQAYAGLAENTGGLIYHSDAIEEMIATYLSGITDAKVDMDTAYTAVSDQLNAFIATQNLYY